MLCICITYVYIYISIYIYYIYNIKCILYIYIYYTIYYVYIVYILEKDSRELCFFLSEDYKNFNRRDKVFLSMNEKKCANYADPHCDPFNLPIIREYRI